VRRGLGTATARPGYGESRTISPPYMPIGNLDTQPCYTVLPALCFHPPLPIVCTLWFAPRCWQSMMSCCVL
jgi:hypothetical protein